MLLKKVLERTTAYHARLSISNDEPSNQFYGGTYLTLHRRKVPEQLS
jgi:hypothetical protein